MACGLQLMLIVYSVPSLIYVLPKGRQVNISLHILCHLQMAHCMKIGVLENIKKQGVDKEHVSIFLAKKSRNLNVHVLFTTGVRPYIFCIQVSVSKYKKLKL